jgi:hypothetical protein
MEDKEVREKYALLTARVLAIRDVVARLLAYEAKRWPDPLKLLEDFSEATDSRIHAVTGDRNLSAGAMALQETIRKETDWIVALARDSLSDDEE